MRGLQGDVTNSDILNKRILQLTECWYAVGRCRRGRRFPKNYLTVEVAVPK